MTAYFSTTKYFLDGANVIADYDGDDVLLATYVTPGLDANLSQERDGSTYYYMADGLGSIRNVVDTNEDTQNIYDYYAFGKELGSWTENVTNRYTYTAREYDTESEQYYYRARYYDGNGRFNRRDPARDGMNIYAYVSANPLINIDPTGLTVWIVVESTPSGEGTLKGMPATDGGGKTYNVPLYNVRIWLDKCCKDPYVVYSVTRDTARDDAAVGDRTPEERCGKYTSYHEAPGGIYHGRIRRSPSLGEDTIILSDKPRGISMGGSLNRTYILIHRGPGYSEGCMLGQGGEGAQKKFIDEVRKAIAEDEKCGGDGSIKVWLFDKGCTHNHDSTEEEEEKPDASGGNGD